MLIFHSGIALRTIMVGSVLQMLVACSSSPTPNAVPQAALAAVQETSGLVCHENQLWTINDSGNSPSIYQVDAERGNVVRTVVTNVGNLDWEALTLFEDQLIIGDIGNNSGQRRAIRLHLLPWPLSTDKVAANRTLDFFYPEVGLVPLQPYQHNLDAEALAANPDGLFLFSKNWLANSSTVYRVDLAQSLLIVQAQINDLPGMLTDAGWDQQAQVFVATGYRNVRQHGLSFALTGDFKPFVALLDRQFRLLNVIPLETQGQVEGLCVDEKQQIWLSQERSDHHPARFWRWGTVPDAIKQR